MLNMNTHAKRIRIAARPSLLSPLQLLSGLARLLAEWEHRARDRNKLAEMPDHLLKDIGISRSDAEQESRKPLWRA